MSELPDKFEAVDPVTGKVFEVNFREHKYDIGETEEYTQEQCVVTLEGESHDFLLADAARALMNEGARREREKAFDEEGIGIANPIDHLCEGCNRTMKFITKVRMCLECCPSEPLKFDKWPGDETDKELLDQLREVE